MREWMNVVAGCQAAAFVAVSALGCVEGPRESSSVFVPPTAPTLELATVTGGVFVHSATGVAPLGAGPLSAWFQFERSGDSRVVPVNAAGVYSVQVGVGARITLVKSDMLQPCLVTLGTPRAGVFGRDVHLFPNQLLGTAVPADVVGNDPILTGRVFEVDGSGRQVSLSGAIVSFDHLDGMEFYAAKTVTDDQGRYLLCGLADRPSATILVSKTGYGLVTAVQQLTGRESTLDVELRRR